MSKLISLLTFASAAVAAAVQARDSTCTPGSITANSRQCTVECGTDHAGGDYSSLSTPDFQSCINACTADNTCETAQYAISNSYCYLKNSVKSGSANSNVNSIVCQQTSNCTAGIITINGRAGTVECGLDHPGGDYSSQYADSLQTCENLCAADQNCLSAQYAISSNNCYLKSSVNPAVSNTNVDGIVFPSVSSSLTTATSSTVPTSSGPVCTTTAPASPYLSNGGFEQGLQGWSSLIYSGTFESYVISGVEFEGCKALSIIPTSDPSDNRQFAASVSYQGLQSSRTYTLSVKIGRPTSVVTTNSAPYLAMVVDSHQIGGGYICGWANTGACPITGIGGASGQVFSATFAARYPSSQATFVVSWIGQNVGNDAVLLDDVEISMV